MAQKVQSLDEFNEIINKGGKTIVFLMTEWLGPAKKFAPSFDKMKLSENYSDINFITVDVDEIPIEFGDASLPKLQFYMRGKLYETIGGSLNESKLTSFLDKYQNHVLY